MAVFSTQDILAKPIENYVWDPNTMAWVKETQPGGSGGGGGPITDGVDPTIKATVFDYANSNPLAVVLRDTNGDYVSVGGGTQYTEDAAAPANPVGTVPMLVRQDTPVGLVTTDGDNVAQRGTNYGAGYVTLLDTAGNPVSVGGGTQYAEDTASTAGELITMAGVVRNDTRGSLVNANGDRTELQTNASGDLRVADDVGNALLASIEPNIGSIAGNIATSANQTNGTQKTLITDGVDILAIDPSGAIAVTLTGNTQVVGTQANNDGPPGSINLGVLPAIANAAAPTYGEGSQVLLSTNLAGAQRITAASLPLPTGASTSALQTQPGVDIGDVTVNNAAGAAAVNIQDGGNSITIDGTVAIGAGSAVIGHVITDTGSVVQANAGTNLNTSALALSATQTDRTQKTQLTDGTRDGTIKAASTLPLLTDTALVTTQRDPLPAGTNTLGAVTGTKTNNSAVPGATNIGTLPAVATAAAPTYIEGNQVGLSTDLSGNVRISGSISASTSADVQNTADDAGYVDGQTGKNLTQTPVGRLKTDSLVVGVDDVSTYHTTVNSAIRDPKLNDSGLVVRTLDPYTPAMFTVLNMMYDELVEMKLVLQDMAGNDLKQGIAKKSGRYFSTTNRDRN